MATLPIARIACTNSGGTLLPCVIASCTALPSSMSSLGAPLSAALERALDSAAAKSGRSRPRTGGVATDPFARARRVSRMSALEASWEALEVRRHGEVLRASLVLGLLDRGRGALRRLPAPAVALRVLEGTP